MRSRQADAFTFADHFLFAFVARNVFWRSCGTGQNIRVTLIKSTICTSHMAPRQRWDKRGTGRDKCGIRNAELKRKAIFTGIKGIKGMIFSVHSVVKKIFPAKTQRCKERQKNFFRDLSRVSRAKNIPQRLKGVKNDRRTDN
jgi:hypothetical protein